jgi:hypothetical protein
MMRTQFTHVEVILLSWQPLPDELSGLSTDWMYTDSRFYRIAQADIKDGLSVGLLGLFESLKRQSRITDFCSRVIGTQRTTTHFLPNTRPLLERGLPDWVRPEIRPGE